MWDALRAWIQAHSVEVVIGIGTAVVIALVKQWRDSVLRWASKTIKWLVAFLGSVPNHLSLRSHILNEKPLWEFRRPRIASIENAPPTVTVMNFKGGVGKTTLSANLAAALALHRGLRVLLIDLDYQGSLSELLKPNTADIKTNNLVARLISRERDGRSLDEFLLPAAELPGVHLISADYELTETEDNQLLRWLINETKNGDARGKIARALNKKEWGAKDRFDVVIMDAPPRLSLAAANALKASRYVIIPTKLQPLSAQPVAKMINYLNDFKKRIRAPFEIAGVVCCMTKGTEASGTETGPLQSIKTTLATVPNNPKIYRQYVPDLVDVGRPQGVRIGYLLTGPRGEKVKEVFDALADEIADQLNLPKPLAKAAE